MANKKTKKNKKNRKMVDLTLRLNVELEQGKPQRIHERVKRITSRKRQNLREMRRGMITQAQAQAGGGGQQSLFANPAFYGNVKMLSDAALNQFQNQRYSLEQQVRESSAEQKAMLAVGRAEAAQQAAQALATQTQQLADLQQRFGFQPQQLAAVAGQAGLQIGQQQERARSAEEQLEQANVEQQYAQEQQTAAAAIPKAELVPQLIPLLNRDYGEGHFTPQGISKHMLTKYEQDIRAAIAGDEQARVKLIAKFDDTKRGRRTRSEPEPQPEPAAVDVSFDQPQTPDDILEATRRKAKVSRRKELFGGAAESTPYGLPPTAEDERRRARMDSLERKVLAAQEGGLETAAVLELQRQVQALGAAPDATINPLAVQQRLVGYLDQTAGSVPRTPQQFQVSPYSGRLGEGDYE